VIGRGQDKNGERTGKDGERTKKFKGNYVTEHGKGQGQGNDGKRK
jgi:hypothetical protein